MVDTKEYIKYIKSKHCLVCGSTPVDPDHLEHLQMGGSNPQNTKDYSCLPFCRIHHRERHDLGNFQFQNKHYIDLWKEAFNLLRSYHIQKKGIK
mgnify:CR=1 FL=1|tara:strand:- start:251 stop:532 length:282 start_codon:yes stop_codon:yes gene_type:complete